jgi:hypothetical protein
MKRKDSAQVAVTKRAAMATRSFAQPMMSIEDNMREVLVAASTLSAGSKCVPDG